MCICIEHIATHMEVCVCRYTHAHIGIHVYVDTYVHTCCNVECSVHT